MPLAAPITKVPSVFARKLHAAPASLGLPQLGDRCRFRFIDLPSIASDRH